MYSLANQNIHLIILPTPCLEKPRFIKTKHPPPRPHPARNYKQPPIQSDQGADLNRVHKRKLQDAATTGVRALAFLLHFSDYSDSAFLFFCHYPIMKSVQILSGKLHMVVKWTCWTDYLFIRSFSCCR